MRAGAFFALVFLLLLLVAVVFLLFGNKVDFLKPYHQKIFGEKAQNIVQAVATADNFANKEIVVPPASENEWCNIQEIVVPTDRETYARDQIIGWDAIEKCCVRKISGFNCALQRQGFIEYCYSGNVGGEVIWANADGYFIDINKRQAFINDLDKEQIPNKPCYADKYPAFLQPPKTQTDYNNLTNG